MTQTPLESSELKAFFAQQKELPKEAQDDLYSQSLSALERKAFLSIYQTLSEEEIAIYNDLMEMDGEVDGIGFLSGIRSEEEAQRLFQETFSKCIQEFITTHK